MGIALSSDSRVFIAEGGGGCGNPFSYYSCMKVGSLSKNFGGSNPVYCPGDTPGLFIQHDATRGDEGAWTTSLAGYKPLGVKSPLSLWSGRRRTIDMQVHFGRCGDLSDPTQYDSIVMLEEALLSGYSADPLGALNGGETAPVMETVNVSAARSYEVFPLKLLAVARTVTAASVIIDVAACNTVCQDGQLLDCGSFYAFRLDGALDEIDGNPIVVMHSDDGGVTWTDYDFATPSFDPASALHSFNIACVEDGIVVIGNEISGVDVDGVVYYIKFDDMIDGEVTDYRRLAIDVQINDVVAIDGKIYAAGADGLVYIINPRALSYRTIEMTDGEAWTYISGVDGDNFMVGSILGKINVYRKGIISSIDCIDVAGENCQLSSLSMRSPDEWYVGTCGGLVYCTNDRGNSFNVVVSGTASVVDIKFATKMVGFYLTRSPCQIYRTVDGGATWTPIRDYNNQVNTALGYWHSIAVCSHDPNVMVAAGRISEGQDDCLEDGGDCQHACEVIAGTDEGILVSGQIC